MEVSNINFTVTVKASQQRCHGFMCQPFHCHVATVDKLFTRASVNKQYNLVLAEGQLCCVIGKVTVVFQEVLAAYLRVCVLSHLYADCLETQISSYD